MSEGDALYQAIVDEPDADDVRLIYSDWLDEHGQPERAEFIRVQVELARLFATPCSVEAGTWKRGFHSGGKTVTAWNHGSDRRLSRCCLPWNEDFQTGVCVKCARIDRLEPREQELWYAADSQNGWKLIASDLPHLAQGQHWKHALPFQVEWVHTVPWQLHAIYRRGFLDEIAAPLDALEQHLPAIVKRHPLTRATPTDAHHAHGRALLHNARKPQFHPGN